MKDNAPSPTPAPAKGFLFRRRTVWLPTWRGVLLILALLVGTCLYGVRHLDGFLTSNHPIQADVLVVEGWMPGYALDQAAAEFRKHGYMYLAVTGGNIEWVQAIPEITTYARQSGSHLVSQGIPADRVVVSDTPKTLKDRTYSSALTLRDDLLAHGIASRRLNLMSLGPHARRSWRLFQKAFGPGYELGVIAVTPESYDPARWWRTSEGVRQVLSEGFAYLYVLFVMPVMDL